MGDKGSLVKEEKNFSESLAPKEKVFYENHALQTRFLIKQNAPHAGFLD